MTEELLLNVIGNIGVPAAVCFYTLFGVNKTLKELTEAINRMANDVQKIDKMERQIEDLKLQVARMSWKDS